MTISFPLTAAEFFGDLKVTEITFYPHQPREVGRSAGGSVMDAARGAPLWHGSVKLRQHYHAVQGAVEAWLDVVARPGATFWAFDQRYHGPAADPDGRALGQATPVLAAIDTTRDRVQITGLPWSYILSPGDRIGFAYTLPTGAAANALHRVVTGGAADNTGALWVDLSLPVSVNASAGAAIELIRPQIVAKLIDPPGYGAGRPRITAGGELVFQQVLG